jgi:hypothetical protein
VQAAPPITNDSVSYEFDSKQLEKIYAVREISADKSNVVNRLTAPDPVLSQYRQELWYPSVPLLDYCWTEVWETAAQLTPWDHLDETGCRFGWHNEEEIMKKK